MKYLKLIAVISLIVVIASCKKDYITQSQLIGTWTEMEPCIFDSSHCYTWQFTSYNQLYVSTPFIDTANYVLSNNNSIQIDESVNCGTGSLGSTVYQISLNGNELTINKFYTPCISLGGVPPVPVDLHLKKI